MGYAKYSEDNMEIMLERQASRERKISKGWAYDAKRTVLPISSNVDQREKVTMNKF